VKNLRRNKLKIRGDKSQERLKARGEKSIALKKSMSYSLQVKNRRNKMLARKSVRVAVLAGKFKGDKVVVTGEKALLWWNLQGSVSNVKLLQVNKNGQTTLIANQLPASGNFKVSPTEDTDYQLLVSINRGKVRFKHQIKVKQAIFMGSRVITPEAEAILQWRTNKKADKISLEQWQGGKFVPVQQALPHNGRALLVPTQERTTYRLVVEQNGEKLFFTHQVRIKEVRPYIRGLKPVTKMKAGKKVNFEIFAYDRSNYPKEIKFHVLANDAQGNFITGLAPDSVTASKYFLGLAEKVEGETFPVKSFQVKEINQRISKPYSIATVLDYSGSMSRVTPNLETAIQEFIRQKNPHDEISVIKFDSKLVRKVNRERNADDIIKKSEFDGYSGGCTALYAGGDEGIKAVENSKTNRILVLFTDGQENSSFKFSDTHAFTAEQLVKRARETNTRIFTICFGRGANHSLLSAISLLTDGKSYFLENESEINQVYQELPYIFKNYYEVSYQPVQKNGGHETLLTYHNLQTTDTASNTTYVGDDFDPNVYETYAQKPAYSKAAKILKSAPNQSNTGSNVGSESNSTTTPTKPQNKPRIIDMNTPKANQPITAPQAVAFFEHNNSIIDKKYHEELEVFVKYLKKNQQASIHILGHSDMSGTDKGCMAISQDRAKAVKQFFVDRGIAQSRLTVKALGRSQPVWSKETQKVHAKENRRVELLLFE
jgi:outer membrane protein OmpA-like peptidoglycan-associated protein